MTLPEKMFVVRRTIAAALLAAGVAGWLVHCRA
jgi:hypothetical protein